MYPLRSGMHSPDVVVGTLAPLLNLPYAVGLAYYLYTGKF